MYKDKVKQREAARVRQQRRRDANKDKGVTNQGVTVTLEQGVTIEPEQQTRTASYQDYLDHPEDYAKRTDASVLNWGDGLTAKQLGTSPFKANRVTLPGDWDYEGCCVQVDGVWTTRRAAEATA